MPAEPPLSEPLPGPLSGPVVYLTGEYPRATDTFIQREVAGLRALGIRVETASIRRTGPEHHVGPEQTAEAAATFHVLEAATSPLRLLGAHLGALARAPGRYLSALRLALATAAPGARALFYQLVYFAEAGVLAAHLRRLGAAHLHNHIATASCTVAMLASRISGVPYSFTMHGPGIFFEPERWRIDAKMAHAAFTACISDFCRSQGMIFAAREHWPRLHIVHCGVDPARYDRPRAAGAGLRLLFVGRLAAVKGVPVLFEALTGLRARHPGLRLTLIGDGPERPGLEAEARALGLEAAVTFAGYRSQAEVAEALAETDILVLPSFAEGVPVVLMEAMAARVPVVTTRIAGIPELVEDGASGCLVPPGDPAALAAALDRLAADADLRARMGAAGRARVVADYDSRVEAARLAALIRAAGAGAPLPVRPDPLDG